MTYPPHVADLEARRSFPDKVRGVMNEGGLFGERQGWHLPGFDTSQWIARDLSEGLPGGGAGVGFFVATFELAFPEKSDAYVSFQYEEENTQPYRALLFVNGWMFGKVRDRDSYIHATLKWGLIGPTALRGWDVACGELGPANEVPCSAGHP